MNRLKYYFLLLCVIQFENKEEKIHFLFVLWLLRNRVLLRLITMSPNKWSNILLITYLTKCDAQPFFRALHETLSSTFLLPLFIFRLILCVIFRSFQCKQSAFEIYEFRRVCLMKKKLPGHILFPCHTKWHYTKVNS